MVDNYRRLDLPLSDFIDTLQMRREGDDLTEYERQFRSDGETGRTNNIIDVSVVRRKVITMVVGLSSCRT